MARTRWERDFDKRCMRQECAALGIGVPENANIRTLKAALEAYYKDAVIVQTEKGVALRQTEKPTSEYTVHFTAYIVHTIRAESEDAALEWLEDNACDYYRPDTGELEDFFDVDIIEVYKQED